MQQIDPWAQTVFTFLREQPLVFALMATMGLDVASGFIAAFVTKKLCSTASWAGMNKKAMMWIVVALAAAISRLTPDIPLLKIVCAFYLLTESLSILENAARAGVPLPKVLVESLQKVQAEMAPVTKDGLVVLTTSSPHSSVEVKDASFVNVQMGNSPKEDGDPVTGLKVSRKETEGDEELVL